MTNRQVALIASVIRNNDVLKDADEYFEWLEAGNVIAAEALAKMLWDSEI